MTDDTSKDISGEYRSKVVSGDTCRQRSGATQKTRRHDWRVPSSMP